MTISQVGSTVNIHADGNPTVGSGTQAVIYVAAYFPVGTANVFSTAPTLGGNAMTLGAQIQGVNDHGAAAIYYLLAPPTGTPALDITLAATADLGPIGFLTCWAGGTSALEFVDAGANGVNDDFDSTPFDVVLDSNTGDLVVGAAAGWIGTPTVSGTDIGGYTNNDYNGELRQVTAGSSTTTLAVSGAGFLRAAAAIVLREAAGGGGGGAFGPRRSLLGVGRRKPPLPDWHRRESSYIYTRRAA